MCVPALFWGLCLNSIGASRSVCRLMIDQAIYATGVRIDMSVGTPGKQLVSISIPMSLKTNRKGM